MASRTGNSHVEARINAIRAARLAVAEHISMQEASEREGSKRSSTQEAYIVLTLGTPEEIAAVETGRTTLGPTAKVILARTPPEVRAAAIRKPVLPQRELEGRALEAAEWAKLKMALDALTSLPAPSDVMTIVKRNPQRAEYVSRKVLTAHTWLEEFVNAWTK